VDSSDGCGASRGSRRNIITGGLAYIPELVDFIQERVLWIAPVFVVPGEDEMLALAEGALRVLRGQEEAKTY